jgi:hypothetical protein
MNPDNLEILVCMAVAGLPKDRLPAESDMEDVVRRIAVGFDLDEAKSGQLRKTLHARFSIQMDEGIRLIGDDHEPWWKARQPGIDPFYWSRFSQFLARRNFPPRVIHATDRSTDEIIDLVGDPTREGLWSRRGLVVGQVQSGKTQAYTALICKAADAGYRVIILLTGMLESLRSQTQRRLDEGFVGRDSAELLKPNPKDNWVGAGLIDPSRRPVTLTSRYQDFRKSTMQNLGFSLGTFNEPILLVLKKNKTILQHLENWLRTQNTSQGGRIDLPMLMIDDEADNASVNTASGEDRTAINNCLRNLINLFCRSSYVGFTATPFANIFIEAETEDKMEAQDLFPRHYLYYLDAPSNYVGPTRVFRHSLMDEDGLDTSVRESMTRLIEDAQASFPDKHKKTLHVPELPASLHEAIRAFLMANVILDDRGGGPLHRSMLVNVSRFTAVQEQVGDLIDSHLRALQQDIRNYSQDPAKASGCQRIQALKKTWIQEYAEDPDSPDLEAIWQNLLKRMPDSLLPVEVRTVNQNSKVTSLDYSQYESNGLRVIAVGGNSLSRGLTLEGLLISYFNRNSQMYDTLLQMGRWFGYRDGYLDLCRLWLPQDALQWYAHITEASEELRAEVLMMQQKHLKPIDFGLKVRAHPETLLVTARNKMRSSQQIEWFVSVSEQYLETARLSLDVEILRGNHQAACELIAALKELPAESGNTPWQKTVWRGIPKDLVVGLLRTFQTHPLDLRFRDEVLADFVAASHDPILDLWDVFIPQGREEPRNYSGLELNPLKRSVGLSKDEKHLLVSGSHSRVGEAKFEGVGLTDADLEVVKAEFQGRGNPPGAAYRRRRRTPLLLLFLVKPVSREVRQDALAGIPDDLPIVALGLSFPPLSERGPTEKLAYRVNSVFLREFLEAEVDEDQEA